MKEQPFSLTSVKTIGMIIYPSLGDSLVFMILAHNLRRNGFKVTVFNNFLTTLRSYFPEEDPQPYPTEETARANLAKLFDVLIYTHHEIIPAELKNDPQACVLEDYKLFHQTPMLMVDIMASVCQGVFGLAHVVKSNGFKIHGELEFRKHHHRVIIHPSASIPMRQWAVQRFIALAHQLKKHNYEPVFVIAAYEQPQFTWIAEQGFTMVANPSIEALPQLFYESGWFIGNDSGVGHLASNIGIPTITLATGKGKTLRWRPGWTYGTALFPHIPLIRGKWKRSYWKYCISVSRVMRAFTQLTKTDYASSRNDCCTDLR